MRSTVASETLLAERGKEAGRMSKTKEWRAMRAIKALRNAGPFSAIITIDMKSLNATGTNEE